MDYCDHKLISAIARRRQSEPQTAISDRSLGDRSSSATAIRRQSASDRSSAAMALPAPAQASYMYSTERPADCNRDRHRLRARAGTPLAGDHPRPGWCRRRRWRVTCPPSLPSPALPRRAEHRRAIAALSPKKIMIKIIHLHVDCNSPAPP